MDSVLGLVRHPGNDALFRAMEMSLLAAVAGQPVHIHAEGLRGTGKTTVMRAVRRALPRIRRIRDCLYNCDPARPHCPLHRSLSREEVAALGEEWVPMPFLEISHSAKVGTVVGSVDLGRLVNPTRPEAALLPGSIPQAHRGIIFVDEINRLAETSPELADVLLDVMGTKPGRVQIEETGLPSVELPVQVSVWAASNPDEDPGPLEEVRRQLSDRFDFVVYTDRPGDPEVVEQILRASGESGWHLPLSAADETKAEQFRTRLAGRVAALAGTEVPSEVRHRVAGLYSRFNVESLRAVQAIHLGVRLAACLESRSEAALEDLVRVTPLALRHRVDAETLKRVTADLSGESPRREGAPVPMPGVRQRFPSIHFGGMVAGAAPDRSSRGDAALPGAGRTPPEWKPAGQAADGQAGTGQGGAGTPGAESGRRPADGDGTVAAHPGATNVGHRDGRAPASRELQWPTRFPPRAQAAPERESGGWLARTVEGLRRNLGLAPLSRPEGRAGGGAGPGGGERALRDGGGAARPRGGNPNATAPYEGLRHKRLIAPGTGALYHQAESLVRQGRRQGEDGPRAGSQSTGTGAGRNVGPAGPSGSGSDRGGQARGVHRPDPLRTRHEAPPNPARPLSTLQPHEIVRTEEELGRR